MFFFCCATHPMIGQSLSLLIFIFAFSQELTAGKSLPKNSWLMLINICLYTDVRNNNIWAIIQASLHFSAFTQYSLYLLNIIVYSSILLFVFLYPFLTCLTHQNLLLKAGCVLQSFQSQDISGLLVDLQCNVEIQMQKS